MQAESYALRVELDNGDIFESVPQKMFPTFKIDSLYGKIGYSSPDEMNRTGRNFPVATKGANICVDMNTPVSQFFRFETRIYDIIYHEHWYLIYYLDNNYTYKDTPVDIRYFLIHKINNNIPNISAGYKAGGNYVVKGNPLGFIYDIPLTYEINTNDSAFSYYMYGHMVTCTAYAISSEEYLFLSSNNSQSDKTYNIFSPILSNNKGNIISKNNTKRKAIGFFEVASKTKITMCTRFNNYDTMTYSKYVTPISDAKLNNDNSIADGRVDEIANKNNYTYWDYLIDSVWVNPTNPRDTARNDLFPPKGYKSSKQTFSKFYKY